MRARNIKPGFFRNEDLVECSFGARLLFIGLWCMADREGRLEDRPKKIKIEIFPADDVDCDALLEELDRHGFIIRYEVEGGRYIEVVNFAKHQKPHVRESESEIPHRQAMSGKNETCGSTLEGHNTNHGSALAVPNTDLGSDESSPRRPDSLNPDSLNPKDTVPIGTVSGSEPDDASPQPEISTRKNSIPYREIVNCLNEKTGCAFKMAKATKGMIKARFGEGYTLADFRAVIDKKARDWLTDDKMCAYLRPKTLFSASNFESYLAEANRARDGTGKVDLYREAIKLLRKSGAETFRAYCADNGVSTDEVMAWNSRS